MYQKSVKAGSQSAIGQKDDSQEEVNKMSKKLIKRVRNGDFWNILERSTFIRIHYRRDCT